MVLPAAVRSRGTRVRPVFEIPPASGARLRDRLAIRCAGGLHYQDTVRSATRRCWVVKNNTERPWAETHSAATGTFKRTS